MDIWLDILIEVAGVIVGFILGLAFPSLSKTRLWMRWRARKAFEKIQNLTSGSSEGGDYRWNAFEVEAITPIFTFTDPYVAITPARVTSHYEYKQKPLPPEVEFLRHIYLPKFIDYCKKAGRKYHDDPTYSLDRVVIGRTVKELGRILTLDLYFSATQFSNFAMANLALDKPLLESAGEHVSIRTRYDLTPRNFDPNRLEDIPLHLAFGTGTVVVTSDNFIVLPRRSATQAIAPGGDPQRLIVHTVGEGMLRPHDSFKIGKSECPSPFLTVKRALKDELNLNDWIHYSPRDIRFLAVLFDFQRYQPIGLFTVPLEIAAEEFEMVWPFAKDAHEHVGMYFLSNEPKEVRKLFEGEITEDDRTLALGSNQARMCLFLSLFYYHPFSDIERAFKE